MNQNLMLGQCAALGFEVGPDVPFRGMLWKKGQLSARTDSVRGQRKRFSSFNSIYLFTSSSFCFGLFIYYCNRLQSHFMTNIEPPSA
ncbi:hypothetical protein IRJ41_008944 [Triplophysa rosa]|uniref:Uncharacterized protein n=1 Tax=Triplophysa rosa TaxID=992332 RepID=A0A9W7TNP4_TRIRA|nr:hypothetical protein IRJ41_008944 [Triplophysa rosa]